jgi:2'-5' RNA ligase
VAHVTVKAQPNLEVPDLWRPAVRAALATAAPFDVALGPVRWFGDGIAFLAVGDSMVALHRLLLDAVETIADGERFEYEGPDFVPHLTLGAEFAGDSPGQLQGIAARAAALCWETFTVTEVVEFRREAGAAEYTPVGSYSLSGG